VLLNWSVFYSELNTALQVDDRQQALQIGGVTFFPSEKMIAQAWKFALLSKRFCGYLVHSDVFTFPTVVQVSLMTGTKQVRIVVSVSLLFFCPPPLPYALLVLLFPFSLRYCYLGLCERTVISARAIERESHFRLLKYHCQNDTASHPRIPGSFYIFCSLYLNLGPGWDIYFGLR